MNTFQSFFGKQSTVAVSAPGRVNLIGEHTDYNGGFVLPCTIPQRTFIELALRSDQSVRIASANLEGPTACAEYVLGQERQKRDWTDYIQGVTQILQGAGYELSGFEAFIHSTVPMGSGLSSSAALEVSMMRALREAFQLKLDDVTIAKLGQRVENEFVGARVGIMDQMASSLAEAGAALFLDTRSLSFERVPLPAEADLIVINSGVSHSNVGGDYNTRRAECEKACELLGVKELRDLGVKDLARVDALPEPLKRRARHVITENERVILAVQALQQGDLKRLGELFVESHASMRDDYQVSIPEIDLLVEISCVESGVYGARLTGGGFGGSIVALAQRGMGKLAAERIASQYAERSGKRPTVLVP